MQTLMQQRPPPPDAFSPILFAFFVGLVVMLALAWIPGSIARKRHYPKAEAINVCGWLGLLLFPRLGRRDRLGAYRRQPKPDNAETGRPAARTGRMVDSSESGR